MNRRYTGQGLMAVLLVAGLGLTSVASRAQDPASAVGGPAGGNATASAPLSKAELKAQRKAERKQRRAVKNAELKQLNAAGYRPGNQDPNYPQNLQNAEKKVQGAASASQ